MTHFMGKNGVLRNRDMRSQFDIIKHLFDYTRVDWKLLKAVETQMKCGISSMSPMFVKIKTIIRVTRKQHVYKTRHEIFNNVAV